MLNVFNVTTSPSSEALDLSGGTYIKPLGKTFMLSLLILISIASHGRDFMLDSARGNLKSFRWVV